MPEENLPFVIFREPGQAIQVLIGGISTRFDQLSLALNQEEDGFLFVPYEATPSYPILWFRPEKWKSIDDIQVLHQMLAAERILTSHPGPSPVNLDKDNHTPVETSQASYLAHLSQIIQRIQKGELNKVVISRISIWEKIRLPDLLKVFEALVSSYPEAFIHLASIPGLGVWMGASPEVLIQGSPQQFHTMALAGTRQQGSDMAWGEKEQKEQAWVSHYIQEVLSKQNADLIRIEEAKTHKAGHLEHLCTRFLFRLEGWQELPVLLEALHPTPAVCGIPRIKAMEVIAQTEKHERAYYTGYLGPVRKEERVSLFVNLRCMQLNPNHTIIYSGGGITRDSNPEQEWEETQTKADTLLAIIKKIQTLAT